MLYEDVARQSVEPYRISRS